RVLFSFLTLALVGSAMRADDPKDWRDLLQKRTFMEGKASLSYRLMKPADYDPKQKYPLVVFLHGAGERGDDNTKQLAHGVKNFPSPEARKKYPCFLIAPQCPTGRNWGGIRLGKAEVPGDASAPSSLVLEIVGQLQKEFSLDDKRIYLTGLSMGGYGTWG